MIYVKVGGKQYPADIIGRSKDPEWDGRESEVITLEMTHAEAVRTFGNDIKWSIIQVNDSYTNEQGETITPETIEQDNSEFCVSGDIIDHRDGTISVKMGKLTDLEETLALVYGGM